MPEWVQAQLPDPQGLKGTLSTPTALPPAWMMEVFQADGAWKRGS